MYFSMYNEIPQIIAPLAISVEFFKKNYSLLYRIDYDN